MESRAVARYVGSSPRKMRLVVDLIRGKTIGMALSILHFSPKHAAKDAEKAVRSAVANIMNREDVGKVDEESLYVKEIFVNAGPMAKRVLPAPQGRAYRIRKRSNHITVVVATKE
ncbi:MAG: 50S ribosomal protein L22 [Candidatus Kryptoniota bacterium]